MAGAFSARERNVVFAGGIFLICFLTYWFVLLPKRQELKNLKAAVRSMSDEYQEVRKIEAGYQRLKRESDPVMNRIVRRGKDFDFLDFVAKTEEAKGFANSGVVSHRAESYGNYEKRSSTFSYHDRGLQEIVGFLKEIENPNNVIAVESLTIRPRSSSDPSKLSLDLKLATVVPVGASK